MKKGKIRLSRVGKRVKTFDTMDELTSHVHTIAKDMGYDMVGFNRLNLEQKIYLTETKIL